MMRNLFEFDNKDCYYQAQYASLIDCLLNVNHPTSWNERFVKQATEELMNQQKKRAVAIKARKNC